MAENSITLDMRQAAKQITIQLAIKPVHWWHTPALWLGIQLIRLGALVGGFGFELEED